jgi:hypothetical protein
LSPLDTKSPCRGMMLGREECAAAQHSTGETGRSLAHHAPAHATSDTRSATAALEAQIAGLRQASELLRRQLDDVREDRDRLEALFKRAVKNRLIPVILPPGLLKLGTRPAATGSAPLVNRIGIVEVADFAAKAAGGPPVAAITATFRCTNRQQAGEGDQSGC